MIRRLNFTRRQKLARGDVTVRVAPRADGKSQVAVTLSLARYRLPDDARVFVEALEREQVPEPLRELLAHV